MAVRWEREELKRSHERGAWDSWGVQDVQVEGRWLLFAFDQRRIYAPLEHREIPNQFAKVTDDRKALVTFVQAYGRLGWYELAEADSNRQHRWFIDALSEQKRLIQRHQSGGVYAEQVEWLEAHARTVDWCLNAGNALGITRRSQRERACERLAENLPKPVGSRAVVESSPILREGTRQRTTATDFVGGMLEDYLWINLRGVRRRVQYSQGRIRSMWGGNSLLESIYTLVTDAVTGGRLYQCEASDCGRVFIQTDERQRFCPPRDGQEKSTCMNRIRVQGQRRRRKEREVEERNGKTTRKR